jgi:hypothetical protein
MQSSTCISYICQVGSPDGYTFTWLYTSVRDKVQEHIGIFGVPANMLSKTFLPAKYNQGNKCFHWWLGLCEHPNCHLHHSAALVAGTDDPSFGKVAAILNNYKAPKCRGWTPDTPHSPPLSSPTLIHLVSKTAM